MRWLLSWLIDELAWCMLLLAYCRTQSVSKPKPHKLASLDSDVEDILTTPSKFKRRGIHVNCKTNWRREVWKGRKARTVGRLQVSANSWRLMKILFSYNWNCNKSDFEWIPHGVHFKKVNRPDNLTEPWGVACREKKNLQQYKCWNRLGPGQLRSIEAPSRI
jgi:hypothetical protein